MLLHRRHETLALLCHRGYLCKPQWPWCTGGQKRPAPKFFAKDAWLGAKCGRAGHGAYQPTTQLGALVPSPAHHPVHHPPSTLCPGILTAFVMGFQHALAMIGAPPRAAEMHLNRPARGCGCSAGLLRPPPCSGCRLAFAVPALLCAGGLITVPFLIGLNAYGVSAARSLCADRAPWLLTTI